MRECASAKYKEVRVALLIRFTHQSLMQNEPRTYYAVLLDETMGICGLTLGGKTYVARQAITVPQGMSRHLLPDCGFPLPIRGECELISEVALPEIEKAIAFSIGSQLRPEEAREIPLPSVLEALASVTDSTTAG